MMATIYGKSIENSNNANYRIKAKRYICWAKGQVPHHTARSHACG
jgi:hypothetical protein